MSAENSTSNQADCVLGFSYETSFQFDIDYISWKKWDDNGGFGEFSLAESFYYRSELSQVERSSNIKVLEVGYGTGAFLGFCGSLGWDVFGVELNDNLISSAKKAGFEVVKPDDLIKFEKSEFDLIVAFDVIEHVDNLRFWTS